MEFEPTRLPEVILIKPRVFGDARGFFFETWHQQKFAAAGLDVGFVQDNHSFSAKVGTIRGLHCQIAPSIHQRNQRGARHRLRRRIRP